MASAILGVLMEPSLAFNDFLRTRYEKLLLLVLGISVKRSLKVSEGFDIFYTSQWLGGHLASLVLRQVLGPQLVLSDSSQTADLTQFSEWIDFLQYPRLEFNQY